MKKPWGTVKACSSLGLVLMIILLAGCVRPWSGAATWQPPTFEPALIATQAADPTATLLPFLPPTRVPGSPILTPTPDAPHVLPTLRSELSIYIVQSNDTLGLIAQRYGVTLDSLIKVNDLADPDHLEVGQSINIPPPDPQSPGPGDKIIPDSELVYGPASAGFDIQAFINKEGGFLSTYKEDIQDIDKQSYSGSQIIARIANEYSVNPRLLLAVLEYKSGWVTRPYPAQDTMVYPMGYVNEWKQGLYHQMAWAADNLNRGYYLWKINALPSWVLADGSVVPISPTINAGTAGVQQLMSLLFGRQDWEYSISTKGVFKTFSDLFGYPFDLAIEPLVPADVQQPPMTLPFEPGKVWSFTGGPHGGWGEGSAWAGIDFAPPAEVLGCVQSDEWVVAVADGPIVRSEHGEVVQDLDGDGFAQTGWTILYMHIETRDRVALGKNLKAGDRIGHPSCEGGVANGTHTHLARRYNGEWIAADGPIPFNLDGWISSGDGNGIEYNGFLRRDGQVVEAWDSVKPENQIQR
jgi:LasA protease